jgi:para-nitrobenzyl esterase
MSILKATTKYGKVVGTENGNCVSFKGIPYAKAPVGELRFMPPVEPESWEGERLCDEFGPGCITPMNRENLPTSEDCLYMNIWTPAEKTDDKLAVMVWIYGGGFQNGNASNPEFDGTELTKNGVVVVNFNYRCGALGFFANKELAKRSPTGTSGNYGILDEIQALKWVHENIAAFGGDPDRVMIHGQSAGGISCRILLTSPITKGLFNRVAVQSGGGLNEADPVRSFDELCEIGDKCLDRLGWTVDDILTKDANEVNTALCTTAKEFASGIGIFQPCVDGYSITEVPGVLISKGEYPENVDVICGTVCGDAWMFCREVCAEIGKNDPLLRAFSYSPSQAWGDLTVKTGRKPIHTYYIERTQPKPKGGMHMGRDGVYRYGMNCPHSSEIVYVFGTLDVKSDEFTDYDREVSGLIMKYWTNFAKTGDPNGEGLPTWPVYAAETPVSFHVSDDGYAVEPIVDSDEGRQVIELTQKKPGMLMEM